MKTYLVFRLYGPLASWGQAAVGGDRPTSLQPTRSAILGLLGAALGIKRDDETALSALQDSVSIAVKQSVQGTLIRDYHTAQVPSHSNKVVHRSRRSELAEDKLNTILSSRDYLCDGLWVVAVSITEKACHTLDQLQAALLKPVFTLNLGRKSCPLALPMQPKLTVPMSLKSALDSDFPALTRSSEDDKRWLGGNEWVTYFWEGDKDELIPASTGVLTTHPWDEPVHRQRWQFKQRTLHQLSIEEPVYVPV